MRTTVQSVLLLVNVLLLGARWRAMRRQAGAAATGGRILVEQADGGFRERLLQNRRRLQSNEASEPAPPPEPQVVHVTDQSQCTAVEAPDYS